MAVTSYPKGALKTVEELFALPKDAILYHVTKLPESAYISKIIIKEDLQKDPEWPTNIKGLTRFAPNHRHYSYSFDTQDTNLDGLNGYNHHFVFLNEEDAEAWKNANVFTDDEKQQRKLDLEYYKSWDDDY